MNKKLLSLFIAGITAVSSAGVLAEEAGSVNLISDEALVQQQNHSAFIIINCTITGIEDTMLTAVTDLGEEILINKGMLQMSITPDGNMTELAENDEVTIYVRENSPMVLSLPAQYSPSIIVKATENDSTIVDIDSYTKTEDGSYINQAGTLVLNIAEETEIIKLSREMFDGNLDGCDLVVVYDMSTYSIPAQTTPLKVIVLNKAAEDLPEDKTFTKIIAGETELDYVEVSGAEGMVPVRAIAEALGFTVEWDAQIPAVMINNGMYSFAIGEDHYTKGKMMPISLGQAAVCVCVGDTGITHVPVSFFTEVLDLEAVVADNTLTISAK